MEYQHTNDVNGPFERNPDVVVSSLCAEFHDALLQASVPRKEKHAMRTALALAAALLPFIILQQSVARTPPIAFHSYQPALHDAASMPPSSASSAASVTVGVISSAAASSEISTAAALPPGIVGIPHLVLHTSSSESAMPPSSVSSVSDAAISSSTSSASVADVPVLVPTPVPDNHAGVYLTAGSAHDQNFLTQTMEDAGNAGANAIVVDAKTNYVFFNTTAPMANKLGLVSEQYNLQDLVKETHQRGMYLIMRYVAVSDSGLTGALPDTQLKDPKTGEVITPGYIDPANPQALAYNSEIICDLAKNGVDEINLDYIRFATSNIYATAAYSTAEKSARINAFVQMARDTINRCGPHTKLGISVFAILGWNYPANVATLGQDIPELAKIADVISPMAYPAMFKQDAYYDSSVDKGSRMYYLVRRTMEGFQQLMGDNAYKLRPWIQGYGVTTKNATDQIQAVMDSNLCGYQFWNADNIYGGPVYDGMKSRPMPDRCK